MLTRMSTTADPASTMTVPVDVRVLLVVWMALWTGSLREVPDCPATTRAVHLVGDRFEVLRVDTAPLSTSMIEFVTMRDRTNEMLVRPSMRDEKSTLHTETPPTIAAVQRACPEPAAGVRLRRDLVPEALDRWSTLCHREMMILYSGEEG